MKGSALDGTDIAIILVLQTQRSSWERGREDCKRQRDACSRTVFVRLDSSAACTNSQRLGLKGQDLYNMNPFTMPAWRGSWGPPWVVELWAADGCQMAASVFFRGGCPDRLLRSSRWSPIHTNTRNTKQTQWRSIWSGAWVDPRHWTLSFYTFRVWFCFVPMVAVP